jgi:hypothetical protein
MFCLILILIVALRAIAPKLVSTTPVLKKYFYNPVDAVFDLFSTIVNLFFRMMKFFAEAVIKGVSDTIRGLTQFVVRNLLRLVMVLFFVYWVSTEILGMSPEEVVPLAIVALFFVRSDFWYREA